MKKILILGATGMLGNETSKYFRQNGNYETWSTFRTDKFSVGERKLFFNPSMNFNLLENILKDFDYVINCLGIINKFVDGNEEDTIRINSIFPRMLADLCNSKNTRLIHITTDCVFSGKKGLYTEEDSHDAWDFYGKSKSLGEPNNCMVLRTSIIGREIHKKVGLIEWAISMRDKDVNGFTNHIWNGLTTKQYSKCCDKIISNDLYEESVFHIFSNIVTKYELTKFFNSKWNLNLKVNSFETSEGIDRTLSTIKELNGKLNIPSIENQIREIE